ncbi:MAG: hypothetical protein ACK487_00800, partial [Sphingomonadales bacterium]
MVISNIYKNSASLSFIKILLYLCMLKYRSTKIFAIIGLILSVGCSKEQSNGGNAGNNDPAPVKKLYEYVINPSTTNNAINSFDNPHYVYIDTRVVAKNKLF